MQVDFDGVRINLAEAYNSLCKKLKDAERTSDFWELESPMNDLRQMILVICALENEEVESVLDKVGDFAIFEAKEESEI